MGQREVQCTRFPSCHIVYIEVLNCLFNLNLFFSGATPCDSTKKAQRNTKEAWTATGTAEEGIYHVPISNLCISTNMKYEGKGDWGEHPG